MSNTTTSPRNVRAAELARHARTLLRAAFPGVKFSVRSNEFSMGSSVDVRWNDGPARADVEAVIDPLSGRSFDGMTDSNSFHDVTLPTGEVVWNDTFVHATRTDTAAEAAARARWAVAR